MKFKDAFAKSPGLIRLNNAGLAPHSRPAYDALQYWNDRYFREATFTDVDAFAEYARAKDTLAKFLGCKTKELAFMQGASHAISQVAFGLKLNPGDEIITWDQEYPSSYYPWLRAAERANGKLITVESGDDFATPVERLLEKITPRTRVIGISWVQFQTGAVTDLKRLREETKKLDIWIVVDGIQGIGARSFDFKNSGIDALCGGSHKWLCSNLSTGYLAVREDRLEQLEPIMVGALTYGELAAKPDASLKPPVSGQRFEPGARSLLPVFALKASLELMLEVGVDTIEAESVRLADVLRSGLERHGFKIHTRQAARTAIVTFSHPKYSANEIHQHLTKFKVASIPRGPGVRLSPHAFNTDEEIEFTLKTLVTLDPR